MSGKSHIGNLLIMDKAEKELHNVIMRLKGAILHLAKRVGVIKTSYQKQNINSE